MARAAPQPLIVHPLDRAAAWTEHALRRLGDARLAGVLLAVAAAVNLIAAHPQRSWVLDTPPYLGLLGLVLASGIAGVAVRLPAAWREWRRPGPLPDGGGTRSLRLALTEPPTAAQRALVAELLSGRGYRLADRQLRDGWAIHCVRHGFSRLAGLASHLALALLVVGAGLGTAFAEETRFGLFPGDQSLLAAPRAGMTAAVRLDRLDAAFDPAGAPLRFDTHVTFIRDGRAVRQTVLQVNDPGSFDGYLIHAWTYGPAVELRVEDLAGGTQFDGFVALGAASTGSRAPFIELPALGVTLGAVLDDAATNRLRVIAARGAEVLESVVLQPGERLRVGPTWVTVRRFGAYVTFVSRRDPGMAVLFAGGGLLVASLALALYFPRRRVSVVAAGDRLRLALRAERFDNPSAELKRLADDLAARLSPASTGRA
ncbi:MAG: cytochrome c biogenesis protein ResB [Chloroflexi bacterium]|nr:cytochrome c biogenesis protein ResB [Chloroflexota bacterium]